MSSQLKKCQKMLMDEMAKRGIEKDSRAAENMGFAETDIRKRGKA